MLEAVAEARGSTVGQIALAYQLTRPWLAAMVVGARTVAQLDENLGAIGIDLGPEDVSRLEATCPRPRRWPAWQIESNEESRTNVG